MGAATLAVFGAIALLSLVVTCLVKACLLPGDDIRKR